MKLDGAEVGFSLASLSLEFSRSTLNGTADTWCMYGRLDGSAAAFKVEQGWDKNSFRLEDGIK